MQTKFGTVNNFLHVFLLFFINYFRHFCFNSPTLEFLNEWNHICYRAVAHRGDQRGDSRDEKHEVK